jgi:hypothetical protein
VSKNQKSQREKQSSWILLLLVAIPASFDCLIE